MTPRVRKLIGLFGIIGFLAAYIWLMSVIADHVPKQWAVQMIFFVLAGVCWGVPILPLIRWMNREPRTYR